MKRHSNLWESIIDFENLLKAAKQAQKGKRFRENVLAFNAHLEQELLTLQTELRNHSYCPSGYRTFEIKIPKKRLISAAPYRDRVVHHALCNIIQPIFEHTFIHDSYANRKGFGSHRAVKRLTTFARSSCYVLQCDIQKYFPNIDHEILKSIIRRKIKCPETLWLIEKIIDHSNPQPTPLLYFPNDDLLTPIERHKGLPVGNLTSQFFANVYLNGFDHFIKEQLKIKKYVRYVDDFALFSDDKEQLQQARKHLENHLVGLRLKIHPIKSQLFQTKHGVSFLGFRVLPSQIRIKSESLQRGRKRLNVLQKHYEAGQISLQKIKHSLQSWFAHLSHGNSWRLREKLLNRWRFALE